MGTDKLNVDCLITVRINLGMGNARSLLVRLFLCRWIVILFLSLKTQHSPFFLPFVLKAGIYEIGLLHQWSSNFSKHWLPGKGWLKPRLLGLTLECRFSRSEVGLENLHF